MARKWPVRLAWLFVIACFLWSGYVTWNATEKLLDGDASSEMVLSSILAEDGGILTTRWHYSTELRVLNTQLVFAPLFHVFSDWHKIRFTGAMIMQLILLLSYGYYCQALGGKRIPCLIGAGLMLLPQSIAYGRIVLYHSYYLPHITFNFILFGLFIRLVRKENRHGFRSVAFFALSFGVGLGGIRHGMITFVPLLLTIAMRYSLYVKQKENEKQIENGMGQTFLRQFILANMSSISWFMGFMINSRVLSKIYSFGDHGGNMTTFPSAGEVMEVIREYFRLFGFDEWYPFFSIRGILAICVFFAGVLAVVCLIRINREAEPTSDSWFATGICIAIILVSICSVLLIKQNSSTYERLLIPAFVMIIPTLTVGAVWYPVKGSAMIRKHLLITSAAAVFLTGLYHSTFFINPSSKYLAYTGLLFQNKENVLELEDAVTYLETENYTLGYAPFWQASVIREMTDGQVRTLAMEPNQTNYYKGWLNEWQLNDPEVLNREKHFLVASNDDTDKLEQAATLQFSGSDYSVWTFSSGEALWEYVN